MMTYDADGNFTDRGTKDAGDAILSLLEWDWKFPLNRTKLELNDPLVNTPDELMVHYAIINYHTIHSTVDVVLSQVAGYDRMIDPAGSIIRFAVDGRYFSSNFDGSDPVQAAVPDIAWSPLALSLLGQLIGGVNSDLTAGTAHLMSLSICVGLGFKSTVAGVFVTLGGLQIARKLDAEAKAADQRFGALPVHPVPSLLHNLG